MAELEERARFEGWAILELMGRNQEVGYVTTEYFGGVAAFRVDTPRIEEFREFTKRPGYVTTNFGYVNLPAGTEVMREAIPARTLYVWPPIYRLNPCTEDVARDMVKQIAYSGRPLMLLKKPDSQMALPSSDEPDDGVEPDDEAEPEFS